MRHSAPSRALHDLQRLGRPIRVQQRCDGFGAEFAKGAFQQFPELLAMLLSNGLFVVSFTAIVLNIILNRGLEQPKPEKETKETATEPVAKAAE